MYVIISLHVHANVCVLLWEDLTCYTYSQRRIWWISKIFIRSISDGILNNTSSDISGIGETIR